ncbi:MAG: CBS domain-containing protein [Gemmataceae bacterium]|nr:CBS domain-containing protein [Gemmataceae bacterium]
MNAPSTNPVTRSLYLAAETAADLMTPNPVSIRANATLREALALLIDRGFSAAPVIDEAGRPVGVLSRTDILVHDRETVEYLKPVPEYYDPNELAANRAGRLSEGFEVERVDPTLVCDMMTPAVFSVNLQAPAERVVADLLALKVHRLFVTDTRGVLVGIISPLDVLAHLRS